MSNSRFTYPFCYTPDPLIVEESRRIISHIDQSPTLRNIFAEGKMLGVLMVELPGANGHTDPLLHDCSGNRGFLYGFSGLAGGRSHIEGFVPPIFDTTSVDIDSSSPEESRRLQEWLFEQYKVLNAKGEESTILKIFSDTGLVPPGGTGDCAAPKMLQYAFRRGMKPLAMGEFWYGASPVREIRRHGCFYPSCTGKCGPLLGYMLQGLDVEPNPLESDSLWSIEEPFIRFEDSDIVVVDKPAGMLAVPGRNARKSLQDWLSEYCETEVFACHRLDMDTSGLMVFAKNREAQTALQRQFEERSVQKSYLTILCPNERLNTPAEGDSGTIRLPLMLDYYDRPRQMVDFDKGKMAVTGYRIVRTFDDGCIEVLFTPLTGRTHQLRVHAAHHLGLDRPIAGDRLYGGYLPDVPRCCERLMLHASTLTFRHPGTFATMSFSSGFNGQDK